MTNRYFYQALVERIVDGDSIEVLIDLGLDILHRAKIRLNGIDTPEIFRPQTPLEKEAGLLVSNYLEELIKDKEIFIKTYRDSKYGDYLADLSFNEDDEKTINQIMLDEQLGRTYSGEKKVPWTEEELIFIINKLS
jgi:micrococcal nuclease